MIADEFDDSRPDRTEHTNGRHGLALANLTGLTEFSDAFAQFRALNVYEHHYVDAHLRDRFTIVRAVLRAERDAVDSCVVAHRAENGDALPEIIPSDICRTVQVITQREPNWLTARLAFDLRLVAGETAILGYQLRWRSTSATKQHARYLPRSLREYLLRVSFDDRAPARCWAFHEPATKVSARTWPLRIGATGSVHAHFTDVSPGLAGIRWSWDGRRQR